jgi:hypothetical protein
MSELGPSTGAEKPSLHPHTLDELKGSIHPPTKKETGLDGMPKDQQPMADKMIKTVEDGMKKFENIQESFAKSFDSGMLNNFIEIAKKLGIKTPFVTEFLVGMEKSGAVIVKTIEGKLSGKTTVVHSKEPAEDRAYYTAIQNQLTRANDTCKKEPWNGEKFAGAIAARLPAGKVTLQKIVETADERADALIKAYKEKYPDVPAPATKPAGTAVAEKATGIAPTEKPSDKKS